MWLRISIICLMVSLTAFIAVSSASQTASQPLPRDAEGRIQYDTLRVALTAEGRESWVQTYQRWLQLVAIREGLLDTTIALGVITGVLAVVRWWQFIGLKRTILIGSGTVGLGILALLFASVRGMPLEGEVVLAPTPRPTSTPWLINGMDGLDYFGTRTAERRAPARQVPRISLPTRTPTPTRLPLNLRGQ